MHRTTPTLAAILFLACRVASGQTFVDIGAPLTGVQTGAAVWGDYDNDGDLDILLVGSPNGTSGIAKIYRNDGGTFVDIGAGLAPPNSLCSAAWGDFDNDGDLDFIVTGQLNRRLYRNDGGTFVDTGLASAISGSTIRVSWGDYDNDGDLDLLGTAGNTGSSAVTTIYRNDPVAFVDIGAALSTGIHSAAWGDYDQDGDLDVLVAGSNCAIWRNDSGMFVSAPCGFPTPQQTSCAWGDYDNDGDLDFVMDGGIGAPAATRLYRNDSGAFTLMNAGLYGLYQGAVAWGDYDNDGDLDLLLTGRDDALVRKSLIYRNDAGTFVDIAAPLVGTQIGSAEWGDYDNDGDLDILLTGFDGTNRVAKVYRNDGGPANTPPAAPTAPASQLVGTSIKLTWTGATDAQTPTLGLSYNLRIGTTPGASDVSSPMADPTTGKRRVTRLGPITPACTWSTPISNNWHRDLYWGAQALDGSFAGSPFSTEQHFVIAPSIQSAVDVANDQGGWIYLTVNRARFDAVGSVFPTATYGVWRHVAGTLPASTSTAAAPAVGPARARDRSTASLRAAVPEGLEVSEVDGTIYTRGGGSRVAPNVASPFPSGTWALVASMPALQQSQYVVAVPTISNASASDYVVTASSTTPSIWYVSDAASGQSVDNLSPAVPAPVAAAYATGATHLHWGANSEPDLAGYRIYRGGSAAFVPGPSNLISAQPDTGHADPGPAGSYYKLSAVDVNGNESGYALLGPAQTLAVEDQDPLSFALEPMPSPWVGGHLSVAFRLPGAASARIELLDVGGRLVAAREVGSLGAGRHVVELNEGRSVPAGLYVVRLTQSGSSLQTRVTVLQ